jgi:hypothetical protein
VFDDGSFERASFSEDAWTFGAVVAGVRRVVLRLRSAIASTVALTSRIWL